MKTCFGGYCRLMCAYYYILGQMGISHIKKYSSQYLDTVDKTCAGAIEGLFWLFHMIPSSSHVARILTCLRHCISNKTVAPVNCRPE